MSVLNLDVSDVQIFSDAVNSFFYKTMGKKADIRTAYLLEKNSSQQALDYQGDIELSGDYHGRISFASPKSLLTHVLMEMGGKHYSEACHLDAVGEISNQIAGFARRHFGEKMLISIPKASIGSPKKSVSTQHLLAYVIPMRWDIYEAQLTVQMGKV